MPDYVMLVLDGPLMSFGAAQRNGVHDYDDFVSQPAGIPPGNSLFPSRPQMVGLVGNALGMERHEGRRLSALSEQLRFAAGITRLGRLVADFQTAKLRHDDAGWTTTGTVEGRRGGVGTYASSHPMRKGMWAGAEVTIAMRLVDGMPAGALFDRLRRPERPLFIGRKAYIPSSPIARSIVTAPTAYDAVLDRTYDRWGMVWDLSEGPANAPVAERDDRGWVSGVHQGSYRMRYDLPEWYDDHDL